MITVLSEQWDRLSSSDPNNLSKEIIEYVGLSTDEKPTELIVTGSTFLEIDTGDLYIYSEETAEWLSFTNLKNESSGGGGDSDFTTCTMTVTGDDPVSLILPFIDEDTPTIVADGESFSAGDYTIPLYKGTATGEVTEISEVVVTGNAEIDNEGYIVVTGDFTIKISGGDS